MRLLTGSDVLVEDKLFATLGTTLRTIVPPLVPPVLVMDTVGFIDRLPHGLVASFRSTLAEAHVLLHVVDASCPASRSQARTTERVLAEIGAAETPKWLVLNKIDRVTDEQRAALAAELPDARVPRAGRQPAMNGRRGRARQRAPAVHVRDHRRREPALPPALQQRHRPEQRDHELSAGPFATIRMDLRRRHHDAHLQRRDGRHRTAAPAADAARLTCWE